eukprot:scaffold47916_cov26-Tisochrysis_lutea.AAC.1
MTKRALGSCFTDLFLPIVGANNFQHSMVFCLAHVTDCGPLYGRRFRGGLALEHLFGCPGGDHASIQWTCPGRATLLYVHVC